MDTAANNSALAAIYARKAVRSFAAEQVPDELLIKLLEAANQAPSGFNLQPWHFVVVKEQATKELLCHVAMDQPQVLEAPITVVFVADPRAWKSSYPEVLTLGVRSNKMTEAHAKYYRRSVSLLFRTGPLGLLGLVKRVGIPLMRFTRPIPQLICSTKEATNYVRAQTMLSAATFMIAAKSAGLDTSPMEGFDEYRLKKLLSIPAHMSVPVIIALGYESTSDGKDSLRLPLSEKLHRDRF